MEKVLSLILGGGKGTRLFPLTRKRAKPAVPFAGKYRLVDIPISNCFNSGFKQIYILTQFNSASLHNHITHTYNLNSFTGEFVEILAAEQTLEHSGWYSGTADAVRKHLHHFSAHSPGHFLVLSGDQLYSMDLRDLFKKHIESGAEVTVASLPVTRERACDLGIMKINRSGRIVEFREKPGTTEDISDMKIEDSYELDDGLKAQGRIYLASMGIYVFNSICLEQALDNTLSDFGKEVIPSYINEKKVHAYIFNGFWEDIGTIRSFYEANMNLTTIHPDFNCYDEDKPIYTNKTHLPASKINACTTVQSLTSDGCIITNAEIKNSIIGSRSIIEEEVSLDGVICMGADYYETPGQKDMNRKRAIPDIGIGRDSKIRRAIIDINVRIGEACRIGIDDFSRKDGDYRGYSIRDGIIVITQDAVIPAVSVI